MSLIAIGDIHGCARTLDALLDTLAPGVDDHLVFIGDYIDRGPDSRGVIDRLLVLREHQSCTFLRGNHEAMMLQFLDRGDAALWEMNGGLATLESYRKNGHPRITAAHEQFVRETELYYDTPDFFFVHAGLKAAFSIAENIQHFGEEVFLWEREHLSVMEPLWEKPVVCGHTPQRVPIVRPRLLCIDTGCVFHAYSGFGTLTAIHLPERRIVSEPYVG